MEFDKNNQWQDQPHGRVSIADTVGTLVAHAALVDKPKRGQTQFPGKESGSVAFNLTGRGREMLKEQSGAKNVSQGDYLEMLIRERAGQRPLRPTEEKQTGRKGGAKSYFFGKNRGTTTAVCVTPLAHRLLDDQVAASRMSRGDYVGFLLGMKAGIFQVDDQGRVAKVTSSVSQQPDNDYESISSFDRGLHTPG
jgi:hypothetical protein